MPHRNTSGARRLLRSAQGLGAKAIMGETGKFEIGLRLTRSPFRRARSSSRTRSRAVRAQTVLRLHFALRSVLDHYPPLQPLGLRTKSLVRTNSG
jgi:hypothetical protein